MNQLQQVYQWAGVISERLDLKIWQAKGAALYSLGVVWSEHNWASKVAEKLGRFGKADSMTRRLQRWLDNPRIDVDANCRAWCRWVLGSLVGSKRVVLLVDLTKLGNRMDVMMIGLAYRKRCIPLVWRCLPGQQPWSVKQVALIMELLDVIAPAIPEGVSPLLQADRGIGNSSTLVKALHATGWDYLVRVKSSTTVQRPHHSSQTMASLIQGRSHWSGCGYVFTSRDGPFVSIHLRWKKSMAEPWCLISNASDVSSTFYAARMWQEESFLDLKSAGWQWQRSYIRHPRHAERLLLVLALAYGWVVALGTRAIRSGRSVLRLLTRGRTRTYSVFRLGLRYFNHLVAEEELLPMSLFFRPNFNHF